MNKNIWVNLVIIPDILFHNFIYMSVNRNLKSGDFLYLLGLNRYMGNKAAKTTYFLNT